MTTPVAPGTAGDQVTTTLFRALAILRVVVMAWAIYKVVERIDEYAHPGGAWAALAVIVVWTGLMTWAYDDPRRRRLRLYLADLAVTIGLVLSSVWIQSDEQRANHVAHMPSFWVMAAVLAWAVGRGWLSGLVAAVAVSAADEVVKRSLGPQTIENIFLLVVGALLLGYTAQLVREAVEAKAAADFATAVATERQRLARAVHDGTLQVLALVQRRGREAGGELAELGRLAGEQEAALRSLVRQQDAVPSSLASGDVDLSAAAERLGDGRQLKLSVVTPGRPLLVSAPVAQELLDAAGACLDNVSVHVGEQAAAWVLVEDLGDAVEVTVRDEGPGIPSDRLEEAEAQGRLGVAESIRGRLVDLGGSATLVSAPGQGTEWELRVPVP